MGWGIAAGMAAAPIVGGIVGNIMSAGDREKAQQAMQNAFNIINAVQAPPDLSKAILIQQFQKAGVYTPQLEQNINVAFSNVANLQENPEGRQAQLSALQGLQQAGRLGETAESRNALLQSLRGINQNTNSQIQSILQNAQARGGGVSSSGAALAAQLNAAQAGANQANLTGAQIGANAAQQALSALAQSGQMGTNLRGMDYQTAMAKAQAADQLARFNAQNTMATQQANTQTANQGQLYNLGQAQQLSNMNTNAANQELYRQAAAKQQYWQDQLNLAAAKANALTGQANYYNNQAAQTGNMWSNIGGGASQGLGAMANYNNAQNTQNMYAAANNLVPDGNGGWAKANGLNNYQMNGQTAPSSNSTDYMQG